MSDSVRSQRRQSTRLPRPWDSPGKNTGVGCHFLLQCMKMKSEREVAQLCLTLSDPMDCNLPGFSIHWIFQARVLEWDAIAFVQQAKSYVSSGDQKVSIYHAPFQGMHQLLLDHSCPRAVQKFAQSLAELRLWTALLNEAVSSNLPYPLCAQHPLEYSHGASGGSTRREGPPECF